MSAPRYPGVGPDERTGFTPYSAFDVPQDLREFGGRYDVEAMARRLRNFRYAEEWAMMTMGGWMATVPEVPVKTGLGKIAWETAQAADALGKRLPELRAGRNLNVASESPNTGFAAFVQAVAGPEEPEETIEKIAGMFVVLKPHLLQMYEDNIRNTDQITDAPTIELLEDIARRTRRHIAWGKEVLEHLCDTDAKRERARRQALRLHALLAKCGGVTGEMAGN
jgi:hypothetical protein